MIIYFYKSQELCVTFYLLVKYLFSFLCQQFLVFSFDCLFHFAIANGDSYITQSHVAHSHGERISSVNITYVIPYLVLLSI